MIVPTNIPFPLIANPFADAPNLLCCVRENEALKDVLVIAHAMGGMVVDADGEQIAVEPNVVAGRQASGLEGKPHEGAWPTDGMHPFDGSAEDGLNATTNPEGEPESGEEVSPPTQFLILTFDKLSDTNDLSSVMQMQVPIPRPLAVGTWRRVRSPPEAWRTGRPHE
jgi:hypothetical protein